MAYPIAVHFHHGPGGCKGKQSSQKPGMSQCPFIIPNPRGAALAIKRHWHCGGLCAALQNPTSRGVADQFEDPDRFKSACDVNGDGFLLHLILPP